MGPTYISNQILFSSFFFCKKLGVWAGSFEYEFKMFADSVGGEHAPPLPGDVTSAQMED